jgi:hypothetical protein
VVIERDGSDVSPQAIEGEGEASGEQTNGRRAAWYRISAEARGVVTARKKHRGVAPNSAIPHAIGDLARGVKDLLVQSR